jgi:hypothetical protein
MRISIAERLHPFSHVPGTACLIPFSSVSVQVFPALLRFQDLNSNKTIEVALELKGPVDDFTITTDLEKGRITVFGQTEEGFVRYHLFADEGVVLYVEKSPKGGMALHFDNKKVIVKDRFAIPIGSICRREESKERLSLGMHKSQDWQMVQRRRDLKEIFPHWIRIAQSAAIAEIPHEKKGMFSLARECEKLIAAKETTKLHAAFLSFFLAGFSGILVPRLKDEEHQGIVLEEKIPSCSPLALLLEGASLIRSLFITEVGERISLLPCLPPEFHAGRYTNVHCANGVIIDMEWSKKCLRRAIIRSHSDGKIVLELQKSIKSFRLRRSLKEKGIRLKAGEPIFLEKGATVYIDCIQK